MGLRTDKQRSQRGLILENSIALFERRGFGSVPVREIAAECALSEGTFFNYFSSKEAVLREWAELGFEASFARADSGAQSAPVRRVVRRWAKELTIWAMGTPEIIGLAWLRIRVADLGEIHASARGRPASLDGVLGLLERGQAQDEIRADLDARQLAQLLRAGLAEALARGIAGDEAPTQSALEGSLTRVADLLLDGFRKRNERVRGPVRAGGSYSSPRRRD